MAMNPEMIMMLAHLADWTGSKMAPDNPFAGYAKQLVSARNFAKQLQTPGAVPGAVPEAAPEPPPSELEPPSRANPFEPGRGVGNWTPERGYLPDIEPPISSTSQSPFRPGGGVGPYSPERGYLPDIEPPSGVDPWEKGVKHTTVIDEDNNRIETTQRKSPAQINAGAPAKKSEEKQLAHAQSVTNPFWSLG